ncbi:putative ORFan [Tupanvirus deep ocean]|uniref:ORFan n=2 Tax=Tupanvirus TaxID=2094720 RepID=A0AC62A973_9VIRU|nr:putative ORFan [Tupanvirus deep ocean]QKU34330.1 putative ORFan [Tupanvirus deep ocean]
MSEETLYGDIFIIPNSLQIHNDTGTYTYTVDNFKGLQVCFEGWITNSECENWIRHGYSKLNGDYISEYFPVELFMGKREGDTVEIVIFGKKCVLRCAQLPYRYSGNGTIKFEDMLYDLTQSFGGVCSPSYFTPPLSETMQRAMLIVNHERYARSINKDSIDPVKFRYYNNCNEQCKKDTSDITY